MTTKPKTLEITICVAWFAVLLCSIQISGCDNCSVATYVTVGFLLGVSTLAALALTLFYALNRALGNR